MSSIATSPNIAPKYQLYRVVEAVDALPATNGAHGINMSQYGNAHIQVVPSGGANPTVAVLWWSEAAGRFVQEHSPISKAGVGADTSFEFTVPCMGRRMFVAVTTMASGTAKILVAGYGLNATL